MLCHANGGQDFLCKGNQQAAEEAQEALRSLAGVVALDTHAHLHHAPAQDDDANGLDAGENEGGQVVDDGQRITTGGAGSGSCCGQNIGQHDGCGPDGHVPPGQPLIGFEFVHGIPPCCG